MNRAQEIRQKRLKQRAEIAKKEGETEKLYDWVLDMLENPTDNNTADKVCLICTSEQKIQVGLDSEKGITDRDFNFKVMQQLANIFNAEEGYTGEFCFGKAWVICPAVVISIE